MRIDEKLKAEIRESVGDMVLAVKVAKVTMDHGEPGTGDLMVEVLVEELLQLHSTHSKCEMVLCNGCCDEDTPCCATEGDTCGEESDGCDRDAYDRNTCDSERTDRLTFGRALEYAKRGRKISRKGWNGKGQFVFVADDLEFHTDADLSQLEGEVYVHDALVFCGISGIQVGWLASQADMLSEDWFVME